MLSSPKSNRTMPAGKQRLEAEQEEKEQLSSAADVMRSPQQQQAEDGGLYHSALQKRRLLVRRSPAARTHSPPSAVQAVPSFQPAPASEPAPPHGRRRVVVVRRSDSDSKQPTLPPIGSHAAIAATSTPSPAALPSPHVSAAVVASADLSSIRERRILARVAASSLAFSAFQAALARRVSRPPAALCMTNASDEYRVRMERAAINEQEKRIARQAAAAHIDAKLTAADEEGGLALPWEQSLRGATNHSVGVGGLFSGLYCKITQADMKEMEIVRSVKLIEEQPALSTQPSQRARGGGRAGRSTAAAGAHQSAAAARLMDEAARLQQLSRLGTLGSKRKAHAAQQSASHDGSSEQAAAQGVDEATLRLGDLIVRGSPLFDNLDPPPPSEWTAAAEAGSDTNPAVDGTSADGWLDGVEVGDAKHSVLGGDVASTFVLSCCSLAFQQTHFPGDKQSGRVTLHNPTNSTLHFAFSRTPHQSAFDACSPQLPARPAFVLSHPVGHVLPLASADVCVTFSPPAAGVWTERWQLRQVDYDGESQPLAAATVTLAGTSRPTIAPHNDRSANQPNARSNSRLTLAATTEQQQQQRGSESLPDVSSSSSTGPASDAELRAAFCSANSSRRLHFHRWQLPDWWRLWRDVRQLHRPLDRQRMEWQLSAQQVERAIQQLPRRHQQRQSALEGRLNELQALAAVVPSPHPARAQLLTSLLAALSAALPPFASQLCAQQKHTLSPPWEVRARERERRLMELEDAMAGMTDEQRQAAQEQQRRLQQEEDELNDKTTQPQEEKKEECGDGEVVASEEQQRVAEERAKRREEAALLREAEQRADAEWRERHSEYKQRLEEETTKVLAGVIGAFEARAGAMGSDEPPPDAEQLRSADSEQLVVQLPVAYPNLVMLEPEPDLTQEKGKGKAVKAKK